MLRKPILIIDDETDYTDLLKVHLEAISDFEIFASNNSEDGIKLAKQLKPLLVLLDILMPGIDGYEVLKRLKSDPDTQMIPVIMLTALGSEESKIKASQLFDEDYLVKPVEARDLKKKIEEVIKRRGA
ncbi:MAG: response regulator [Candidatus Omnitrophica bacterium]|nr:response regulator [Candidatus Omnitrophota bacterium]